MRTKEKLPPIKVCKVDSLKKRHRKYADKYIPNIKTKRNNFGYDSEGRVHFVYCIVNLVNSKFYIGKHTTDYDPNKVGYSFYHGTSKHLHNSMRKYGTNKFRMLILRYFRTPEKALEYETKVITKEFIESKYCYNLQGGGKAFACGEKHHIHKKVKDGTHNFLTRPDGTNVQTDRVLKGTNPFLRRPDGSSLTLDLNLERVKNGTHPFLKRKDGSSWMLDQTLLGKNPLQRRFDGSSVSSDLVRAGKHAWLGINPWDQKCATIESLSSWYLAERISKINKQNPRIKGWTIRDILLTTVKVRTSPYAINSLIKKLNKGWNPKLDASWQLFYKNHKKVLGI